MMRKVLIVEVTNWRQPRVLWVGVMYYGSMLPFIGDSV